MVVRLEKVESNRGVSNELMQHVHESSRGIEGGNSMDKRQLTYFLTTAQCQHMGIAAAELRISESTLSRSIARLEQEHGVKFFDRVGRGVKLNAIGRAFTSTVEQAFGVLEKGEREIQAMARSGSARFGVGFIPSLGPRVVPALLASYTARVPNFQVRLVQAETEALRTQLLDGELDLTLVTKRFEDAAVNWRPLWNEGLIALVHSSHRLADSQEIDISEIAGDQILSFRYSDTARTALSLEARGRGVAPNVVFSCDDIATLTGLVAGGFGTAVVPENLYLPYQDVHRVRLTIESKRAIGIAYAKSRPLPEPAADFLNAVLASAGTWPQQAV